MGRRSAKARRTTKETGVSVALGLEGSGRGRIETTIPFLDHMLELLATHGRFDLRVKARGDTHVDEHHLVEDAGLTIGQALRRAVGTKRGLNRFGFAQVPMDEALAEVTVDLGGRPYFCYNVQVRARRIKQFDVGLVEEFLRALATSAAMNLHVRLWYGRNAHHCVEAIFKALGRALGEAVRVDPRVKGVPSTKGRL